MRTTKILLFASVALSAICASEVASAQTVLRGGGATFPSVAYRNLFDCATFQPTGPSAQNPSGAVTTPLSASCVGTGPNFSHGSVLVLYAPVGSGAGKAGFAAHSVTSASLGTNAWAAKVSGNIPYADTAHAPTWPYADSPGIQFAGSDDPLLPSDVAAYNTNNGPAKYGKILFIPAVIGPVAVSINPTKDGAGVAWAVANNTIKLSRKSVCGIFSGHITHWDASSITADNGGTVGTGPITVVHRTDGSGTNFLFTNALVTQCRTVFGANKDDGPVPSDSSAALYAFPWTDKGISTAACPNGLGAQGGNTTNWPDATALNQCGNTTPVPAGAAFIGAQGNGGVATTVATTNGAIGYNTADQTQPVLPSPAPQVALLQSQYDIDRTTGLYHLPTAAAAQISMSQAVPVFATDTDRADPLNWASQGTVPNPSLSGSYPIAGFSWFVFYQCYADPNVASFIPQYLQFHYASPLAANVLNDNAMAVPPAVWTNNISTLISTTSPISSGTGQCVGKSGA